MRAPRFRAATLLLALALSPSASPVRAALAPAELDTVGLSPAPGARLPPDVLLDEASGAPRRLGDLLGARPILLVLADYDCREICGSLLSVVGGTLAGTGLEPGRDMDLVVVGLDPAATARDAARMGEEQLGPMARQVHLLSGRPDAVARVEAAIGYRALFDAGSGRYAHPTGILVLTPDGAVSRQLPGLSLDADTLRLALVEAGEGRIGTLADRFHLLCYGLDPAHGVANGAIRAMLATGGVLTLAGLGGFILALVRRPAAAREGS